MHIAGVHLTAQLIVLILAAGLGFYLKKQGVQVGMIIMTMLIGMLIMAAFPAVGSYVSQALAVIPR